MEQRLCFGAGDINKIVKTMPQSEILREIRLAQIVLSGELSEPVKFYWEDRLGAYRLALDIAKWYGKDLVTPELELKAQIQDLQQKLYTKIIPNITVRGGIPVE